ncbi:hypothetical protein ACFL08_05980 [Patescibacteria group bacterium]
MKRKIMMIRVSDPKIKEMEKIDFSELPSFVGECDFNGNIHCIIQAKDGRFLIGGEFTKFNGRSVNCSVCLNPEGTVNEEFMRNIGTGFNVWIRSIIQDKNGNILIGGAFSRFNGQEVNYFVCLNPEGTVNEEFMCNIGKGFNSRIEFIFQDKNGNILIGGAFSRFNGREVNCFICLNSDRTINEEFMRNIGTGFNRWVECIFQSKNGNILIGGKFSEFNGREVNYFICLNSDGTINEEFMRNIGTGFNHWIKSIVQDKNGNILIGGKFSEFNGREVNYFICLNFDGTINEEFMRNIGTGFNRWVKSIIQDKDGNILIGGKFSEFNGQEVNCFICLNPDGTVGD